MQSALGHTVKAHHQLFWAAIGFPMALHPARSQPARQCRPHRRWWWLTKRSCGRAGVFCAQPYTASNTLAVNSPEAHGHGKILGGGMVGTSAGDMIGEIALAIDQTIAEHFETWHELASAGQFDGQGDHHSPKPYVRQAFRQYLECGIFAHGFARACCDGCGHDYDAHAGESVAVEPDWNMEAKRHPTLRSISASVGARSRWRLDALRRLAACMADSRPLFARGLVIQPPRRLNLHWLTAFESQNPCHTCPRAVEFPIRLFASITLRWP